MTRWNSGNLTLSALFVVNKAKACDVVIAALKKTDGNVREAAKILKIERRTLTRWVQWYPELKEKVAEIRKARG